MNRLWMKINWLDVYPVVIIVGIVITGLFYTFASATIFGLSLTITFACATLCHKLEIKKYETERLNRLLEGLKFNEYDPVDKSGTKSYAQVISYIRSRMLIMFLLTVFFFVCFMVFLLLEA